MSSVSPESHSMVPRRPYLVKNGFLFCWNMFLLGCFAFIPVIVEWPYKGIWYENPSKSSWYCLHTSTFFSLLLWIHLECGKFALISIRFDLWNLRKIGYYSYYNLKQYTGKVWKVSYRPEKFDWRFKNAQPKHWWCRSLHRQKLVNVDVVYSSAVPISKFLKVKTTNLALSYNLLELTKNLRAIPLTKTGDGDPPCARYLME